MHEIVQIFRRERFSAKETVCGNLVVYQTKLPAFPHTQLVAETTLDWTSPNRLDTYRSGHVETVQVVQRQIFSRVCLLGWRRQHGHILGQIYLWSSLPQRVQGEVAKRQLYINH